MDSGLDTLVGERGFKLSGGEKQSTQLFCIQISLTPVFGFQITSKSEEKILEFGVRFGTKTTCN
jgi:hypothetical protein